MVVGVVAVTVEVGEPFTTELWNLIAHPAWGVIVSGITFRADEADGAWAFFESLDRLPPGFASDPVLRVVRRLGIEFYCVDGFKVWELDDLNTFRLERLERWPEFPLVLSRPAAVNRLGGLRGPPTP